MGDNTSTSSFSFPHFVFGYGSLICPQSRAITAPTIADRSAIPVVVQNVERVWAKRSRYMGITAMGVQLKENVECVGVLIPCTTMELHQFDGREVGYERYLIPQRDVTKVPFLNDSFYTGTFLQQQQQQTTIIENSNNDKISNGTETTLESADGDNDESPPPPHIWVYVQCESNPPTQDYPIVQSYVDIMLRGCLSISQEFAEEFIKTTKGWDPSELQQFKNYNADNDHNNNHNENSPQKEQQRREPTWLDDRKNPYYMRADEEYSSRYADALDELLHKYYPTELDLRRRRRRRLS